MTAIDTGTDKMLAHVEDGIGWMTYNNPARLERDVVRHADRGAAHPRRVRRRSRACT